MNIIDQLKTITHVAGHIVQPSEVKECDSQPDLRLLGIGVDGETIHIHAETASADALVASVRQVLADGYTIEEIEQQIEGCVSVKATAKETQVTAKNQTGDSHDATANTPSGNGGQGRNNHRNRRNADRE